MVSAPMFPEESASASSGTVPISVTDWAMPRALLSVTSNCVATHGLSTPLRSTDPIGLCEGLDELSVPGLLGLAERLRHLEHHLGGLTIPGFETACLVEDEGDGSIRGGIQLRATPPTAPAHTPTLPLIPEPFLMHATCYLKFRGGH